jgi:2-polyprenyl-3-methyl-5-hydroxy-6-metoxy-1,4-benzoquinol methylase
LTYAEKLALEAEFWGSVAEQQALTVPPEWRYHRQLRRNAILNAAQIDALLSRVWPGSSVLDLGCGSGWLTLALAERGARVLGLDIGDKAIEVARTYYQSVKTRINGSVSYQVADLNTIQLPLDQYDVVVAKGIWHHLVNPEHLADQIQRTLKPDGLLWVSDINGEEGLAAVLIASALTFVLPTQIAYRDKIRGLLRFGLHAPERIKASMQCSGASPFEGAGRQWDWTDLIANRFDLEQRIDQPAFTGYVASEINLPDRLALPLLRSMHRIDSALVKHGILHGTGLLLCARKRKSQQPVA